jgi:hypothetical protein
MTDSAREKKFRELIERVKISKDFSADKAEELKRVFLPSMVVNAPYIISELISAGLPRVDAEDAICNLISLLRVVPDVYGRDAISDAINELSFRKRQSENRSNSRGHQLDEFDNLALELSRIRQDANGIWDLMVRQIEEEKADPKLYLNGSNICLDRSPNKPRQIKKRSFSTIFSRLKKII